jgi:hypothetical protein
LGIAIAVPHGKNGKRTLPDIQFQVAILYQDCRVSYTKTIVCLANSRKLTGRCVAGKEWDGRTAAAWCRPVSARERGELTAERWYAKSWRDPLLLDLIEVALLSPHPSGCQTENHLVDTTVRWKFRGRVTPHCLLANLDHPSGPLWVNGESTSCGLNDRVSVQLADEQTSSLVLVQPDRMTVTIGTEGAQLGQARRRVRGLFTLSNHEYALSITDPVFEKTILPHPDGFTTELQKPILCISLSEKFASQNACYKLIAGVIQFA